MGGIFAAFFFGWGSGRLLMIEPGAVFFYVLGWDHVHGVVWLAGVSIADLMRERRLAGEGVW